MEIFHVPQHNQVDLSSVMHMFDLVSIETGLTDFKKTNKKFNLPIGSFQIKGFHSQFHHR